MKSKTRQYVLAVLRVGLGMVFLYAGIVKISDTSAFGFGIGNRGAAQDRTRRRKCLASRCRGRRNLKLRLRNRTRITSHTMDTPTLSFRNNR